MRGKERFCLCKSESEIMRERERERERKRGAHYGVVLVSRIDKIVGLFCQRALEKRRYSAKETHIFFDPANRSHPIPVLS